MAADKPAEHKAAAQRSAELILTRLSDYLSTRFDLAGRINPQLKLIKQDLMYHELVNVRRSLLGEKIYGPIRLVVAEVFLGDDEKRRRGLMSPTDQTSIQVELVSHCQDERTEATRGQIRIHDLKSFYAAIDPNLTNLMDLLETWLWWDILDATELVRFEQKLGLIAAARQGRISEEMRRRYSTILHPAMAEDEGPATSATDEEVIKYEIQRLLYIRDQWAYRRGNERGFMYVLKRDELTGPSHGELIHQIAGKVRDYDAVDSMEEIDDAVRHRYAADLRLTPDKVTRQGVVDFLQNELLEIEREVLQKADRDSRLGPPYNYKERQLEQMDKWLNDLNQQLRGIVKALQTTPSAAAAAPTPPPAPPTLKEPPPPPKPVPTTPKLGPIDSFDPLDGGSFVVDRKENPLDRL